MARAPFLDAALLEYLGTLPDEWKIRGFTTKWILKEAFRDLLPDEIYRRGKGGFGVPLGAWFRGRLETTVRETLMDPGARIFQFLSHEEVRRLLTVHRRGRRDLGHQIWSLLILELWLRRAPWAKGRS